MNSNTVELSPNFNKETMNYEIIVPVGTTKMQFIGEAENTLSTVSGLGYIPIQAGDNTHEIKVTAENGSARTYVININRVKSTVNDLVDLIPSIGTLDPSFTYGTLEYNLTLGNADSLLSFEVLTEDRFATVKGNEEQEVPDGESVRKIIVTAENGDTKTYKVNINRIRTDDARLKSLAVKSFTIDQEFNSDVYEYTLTVPNDKFVLTENEIVALPFYEDTKVYPDVSVELSVLKLNKYQIKTIAPDGYTTQTYTIYITREKSSDSTLEKLAVSGYEITPEFNSNTLEYMLKVPKGTTILKAENVIAIPTDEYAIVVKSGDLDLTANERVFNIDVTSHNGERNTTYKIKVEIEKSDNNYLESLTTSVGILSPEFDKSVTQYSLHLTQRQDTLEINAVPEDETATIVSGTGTYNITEEDTRIIIMVKAENEKLRAYIIDVTKEPKTETIIRGKVTTENVNNIHTANIKVYKDNELKYEEKTKQNGSYEIYVVPDTYKVIISKEGYLNITIEDILIESIEQEVTLDSYKLVAGDVVESGEIELDDMVALNDKHGETITDANKKEMAKYDLNEDGIVNKLDRDILKENYGKKAQKVIWTDQNAENMILPLKGSYVITSEYGTRVHPITGEIKTHSGLDIVGAHHGNILAVASGEVTYAGVQSGYGNCVEIKHIVNGETIYSFYAHLSQIDVAVGQAVTQGEVVGLEGGAKDDPNHGTSTGHHLHFELRNNSGSGNSIDPNKYINF